MRSGARPRRRKLWWLAGAAAAIVAFALGIALGQALEENPEPGPGSTTVVRTLTIPLEP
jgi:hypothetical protein